MSDNSKRGKKQNQYPHHTNQDQEEVKEKEDNTCVWIKNTSLQKKNRN
ncbi:MAG: hypothetical protein L0H53_11140 [Candidatus Nitrosocosmicus sp.]|nr:hypothetical protein [Candidatus Nitrosocosmicus sp.]